MAADAAVINAPPPSQTTIATPHLLLPGELLISFTLAERRPMRRFDGRGSRITCDCVIAQWLGRMEILSLGVGSVEGFGFNDPLTFNLRARGRRRP